MTVGLAELSNYGEDAPQPGEHVWAAIASELGFSGTKPAAAALTGYSGISDGPAVSAPPAPSSEPGPGSPTPPVANPGSAPVASQGVEPVAGPGSDPSIGLNGSARSDLRSVAGTGSDLPRTATPPPGGRRWSRWAAPIAAAVIGIAIGAGAVVI